MKKVKTPKSKLPEGDMRRYDWSRAVRGKYVAKASKATEYFRILDPTLARKFPDDKSVNAALRRLLKLEGPTPRRRATRTRAA